MQLYAIGKREDRCEWTKHMRRAFLLFWRSLSVSDKQYIEETLA